MMSEIHSQHESRLPGPREPGSVARKRRCVRFPLMERNTRQRTAIRRAFETANRPLAPAEVLEVAQDQVPRLGIATVYRAIRDLQESGWLTTVELPGEPARYERAHLDHHHHFRCRECSRVFEVHGCPADLSDLAPKGFEVDDHEVVLYGRCESCIPAA